MKKKRIKHFPMGTSYPAIAADIGIEPIKKNQCQLHI
jgi:hypothetical protein